MPNKVLFRGAQIFDGFSATLRKGWEVLVVGDVIYRVSDEPLTVDPETHVIDCGGRVLMPGLIDAHVHVYAARIELPTKMPATYLAHYAPAFLGHPSTEDSPQCVM